MSWNLSKMNGLEAYTTLKFQRVHPCNIPWRGAEAISFQVYRIPVGLLSFNFNNTRIRSELEGELQKSRQNPDPGDEKQVRLVQRILLESRWVGIETSVLMDDLQKRGQLDPVVSTPDGTLIDGNRRLAIFRHLVDRHPDSRKFGELEVCVLPRYSTGDDLWELDARLQTSHRFPVPHSEINTALKFRHLHRELGWELDRIEEMAGSRYRKTKIQNMIGTIDTVDEYLGLIPPKNSHKKRYSFLDKGWGCFDTIHRIVRWTARTRPNDWEELARNRKHFGFAIIRSEKTTCGDVENFYSVLRSKEASRKLVKSSDILKGKRPRNFLAPAKTEPEIRRLNDAFEFLKALKTDPGKIAEQAYRKLDTIKTPQIKKNGKELKPHLDKILMKIRMLQDQL